MKKFKLLFLFALLALLSSCATVTPNTPGAGNNINQLPLKISQTAPVYYEYTISSDGCSEVDFLKKFVGNRIQIKNGTMHVDNILDIHVDSTEKTIGFWVLKGTSEFKCKFWGIAVEYDLN